MSDTTLGPTPARVNTRKLTPADWHRVAPHPAAVAVLNVLESWFRAGNHQPWQPWPGVRELAEEARTSRKVARTVVRRMIDAGLLEVSDSFFDPQGRRGARTARLRYCPRAQVVPVTQIDAWIASQRRPRGVDIGPLHPIKSTTDTTQVDITRTLVCHRRGWRGPMPTRGVPDSLANQPLSLDRVNVASLHLLKPEVAVIKEKNPGPPEDDLRRLFDGPKPRPRVRTFQGVYRVRPLDRPVTIPAPGVRMPTPTTDAAKAMVLWTAYKGAFADVTGKRYGNWRVKAENVHRQRWFKGALEAWALLEADGRVHPQIWAKWFMGFAATAAKSKKVLPFPAVFSPKVIAKWLGLCWHQEKPSGRSLLTRTHREQWLRREEAMLLNCGALRPGAEMPDHFLVIQTETCTWYRDLRRREIAAGHVDPNDCWRAFTADDHALAVDEFHAANPSFQFGEF